MSQLGNDERSYNGSTRLMTESCGTRPASSLWRGTDFGRAGEITQTPTPQAMANASTLEQRKTKLAAVSTRKPAVANAFLRMGLPNGRLDLPKTFLPAAKCSRAARTRAAQLYGGAQLEHPVYSTDQPLRTIGGGGGAFPLPTKH